METKQNYAVPVSIVIAGLLIAGAVYFRGEGGSRPVLNPVALAEVVDDLDINQEQFGACIQDQTIAKKIEAQTNEGFALGGQGTPFSVIINNQTGRKVAIPGALKQNDVNQLLAFARTATSSDPILNAITPVTAEDRILGKTTGAEFTIVEYSDLRCPFCNTFHGTLHDTIEANPNVQWVFRHMPLAELHPDAPLLAQAAECVAKLGNNEKFWQFTDKVFELDARLVTSEN